MIYTNKLVITFALLFLSTLNYAQIVTNQAELKNAIDNAVPGTTIILANGIWKDVFINIDKNGTESEPITITAQNPGSVLMTGNARVYMEGAYLTVSGLVFQDPANLILDGSDRIEPVIELKQCDYCKILNNKIDSYNGTDAQEELIFKWVLADGQHNEIAYNSFLGKHGIGSIINDNRNSKEPDYLSIHHNYFADRTPINEINGDNNQDAIRIGNSGTSLDDSFSEVYNNYFNNFFGEIEVISNKSGQNKYYNNTFRNYGGTLTLRHGNNCEVFGNYFFAENNLLSGGVRVIGEGHKIYNNYIEGVNSIKPDGSRSGATGGVNVSNGRPNTALNGYYQVKNTQIINNTFVNCDYALRVGTSVSSTLTIAPENLIIANNIAYNSSINDYQILTEPTGNSLSEGNITDLPENILIDDGKFHRLVDGSTPIDASIGRYDFLMQDILGGNRDANVDAGAEEFGANGNNLPYNNQDVGVNIGFGTGQSSLTTSADALTFDIKGGNLSFDIISNVNWEIIEDLEWLTLDVTEGFGTTSITATVSENAMELERTGEITIKEIAGGDDLTTILSILQLNTFLPAEISVIGTNSLGTQDKEEISEENAFNDDISNYWTGNPDTEDEVSITFDLSCRHILTEIGINFWKADERTTTFSIAIANKAEGPYTILLDNATSADAGVTVNSEQRFSLNNTVARYVKFIGIGNSSASNWTSIANINIYGNTSCELTTSIFSNPPIDQSITLFPVPVTNGTLTISSDAKTLNGIKIYSSTGQEVLTTDGHGAYATQINVSELKAGIYFIKLENIGFAKFILK